MASAIEILNLIRKQFPQVDPTHEDYDTGIDSGDAVDFICDIVPQIIEILDRPAPKVAVILEGGLVQDIVSDSPEDVPATFMVVDYSADDCDDDDEDVVLVEQGDGNTARAYARTETVYSSGIDLDVIHADISKREG